MCFKTFLNVLKVDIAWSYHGDLFHTVGIEHGLGDRWGGGDRSNSEAEE